MPTYRTLALVLAGVYLSLNASWSLSPATAHLAMAMFYVSTVALYFLANTLPVSDDDVLRAMAIGLYAGLVIGGAAFLISGRMARTITRREEKCSVS